MHALFVLVYLNYPKITHSPCWKIPSLYLILDSTWLTSTSCFIISAVFAGIVAEVANVLDKDSLHASVSVQGCGGD